MLHHQLKVWNKYCRTYDELFIFYCNDSSFERLFCMKTVKSRLFKKYLKRKKLQVQFCLYLGWLDISEKNIEKCNSLFGWAYKVEKMVVFGPTLTIIFLIFESMKRVNYMYWKRLVLVHLRRYYKSMYIIYNSTFMFLKMFLWDLKIIDNIYFEDHVINMASKYACKFIVFFAVE